MQKGVLVNEEKHKKFNSLHYCFICCCFALACTNGKCEPPGLIFFLRLPTPVTVFFFGVKHTSYFIVLDSASTVGLDNTEQEAVRNFHHH